MVARMQVETRQFTAILITSSDASIFWWEFFFSGNVNIELKPSTKCCRKAKLLSKCLLSISEYKMHIMCGKSRYTSNAIYRISVSQIDIRRLKVYSSLKFNLSLFPGFNFWRVHTTHDQYALKLYTKYSSFNIYSGILEALKLKSWNSRI